jgi:hypothetical protein
LSAISTEAAVPKTQRRSSVAMPLINRLREIIGTAADLATIGQIALPLLLSSFGLK